jgi:hypothetical protein
MHNYSPFKIIKHRDRLRHLQGILELLCSRQFVHNDQFFLKLNTLGHVFALLVNRNGSLIHVTLLVVVENGKKAKNGIESRGPRTASDIYESPHVSFKMLQQDEIQHSQDRTYHWHVLAKQAQLAPSVRVDNQRVRLQLCRNDAIFAHKVKILVIVATMGVFIGTFLEHELVMVRFRDKDIAKGSSAVFVVVQKKSRQAIAKTSKQSKTTREQQQQPQQQREKTRSLG